MQNNPLYGKLKQIAINNSYTTQQVVQFSAQQLREILENNELTDAFCENMKGLLISFLESQHQQSVLQDFEEQLVGGNRVWLKENFPDAQFEVSERGGITCITVWLEGKPDGS